MEKGVKIQRTEHYSDIKVRFYMLCLLVITGRGQGGIHKIGKRRIRMGAEKEGGLMKGKEEEECQLDRETAGSSCRPICGASTN